MPVKAPVVVAAEVFSMIVKESPPAGTKPPTAITESVALGLMLTAPSALIFSNTVADVTSEAKRVISVEAFTKQLSEAHVHTSGRGPFGQATGVVEQRLLVPHLDVERE